MGKLKGKVAVVTGASKGIGAEIARAFGAAGASVVVNYASSKPDAERVVAEIVKADGRAIAVQGDVSKSDDVKRLFAETKRAFGAVDVLVNNAGVYSFAALEEVTEAEFHRQFNTNVLGPILTAREALSHFNPQGGSVINIGSLVSRVTLAGTVVYAATKHALDGVTAVLALELAPKHIRVNSINPGPVVTEGARVIGIEDDMGKQLLERIALGRIGQTTDIAPAAVFLASDDAGWVTGETFGIGGGIH